METLEEDEFGEGEMDNDPQGILPPQEAYDAMTFMAPLNDEEDDLIDEVPGLMDRGRGQLMFVDDADHEQWIRQMAKNGTHGIDRALEDAMYGDESEIGLKLKRPRLLKKLGRGLKSTGKVVARNVNRGSKVVARSAKKVGKAAVKLTKGFDPRRDAAKAKMIKGLNMKLVKERANFLQAEDLKRGIKKPRGGYEIIAKAWARNKIQGSGLPVSMMGESVVSGMIKGDVMGAWYNPASWFKGKTKYVLETTEGERLAVFNPSQYAAYTATRLAQRNGEEASAQEAAEPTEEYAEEAYAEEEYPEEETEMEGDDMYSEDEYDFVVGDEEDTETDDNLGQFVTEILGDSDSDESGAWAHKLNPAYWVKSKRERKFIDAEKNNWDENYQTQKRLKEQRRELEAGRRAVHATSTANRVKNEAAAIDAELKQIEASVDGIGSDSGSFIGAVREQNAKNHKLAKVLLAIAAKRDGVLKPGESKALHKVVRNHLKVKKARKSVLSGENRTEILGDNEYDFVVGSLWRKTKKTAKKAGSIALSPSRFVAKKIFGKKKKSPAAARLSRMNAAQKRRVAALKKRRDRTCQNS